MGFISISGDKQRQRLSDVSAYDRIQENPRVEENPIQFIVINLGNYVEKRGLPAGVNREVALYLKLLETVH